MLFFTFFVFNKSKSVSVRMAHEDAGDQIAIIFENVNVFQEVFLLENVLVAELKDDLAN